MSREEAIRVEDLDFSIERDEPARADFAILYDAARPLEDEADDGWLAIWFLAEEAE